MANNKVNGKKVKTESKFKKGIFTFFKAIISNNSAIEGAKTYKWYIALIIGFVSVVFAILPLFISSVNSTGAPNVFGNGSFGFERQIAYVTKHLKADNKALIINDSHELILTDISTGNPIEMSNLTAYNDYEIARYESDNTYLDTDDTVKHYNVVELRVFYSTDVNSSKDNEAKTIKSIKTFLAGGKSKNENLFKVMTTDPKQDTDEEGTLYYRPNYLFLYKKGYYLALTQNNGTKVVGYTNFTTDFKHFKTGTNLLESAIPTDITNPVEYEQVVLKNWKGIVNKSFLTQKYFNMWFTPLLYTGIYTVLIAFLGLMLFLLTRGKSNIFNYLKITQTLKMAAWASFTPALITLIVGLFMSRMAMMIFIITVGMRSMWMAMRQLRPQ